MENEERCRWQQEKEDNSGVWHTDCGTDFWLDNGSPEDNKMVYCTYCGKKLRGIPYQQIEYE